MTVQPIPNVSERINDIRGLTAEIVNKEILPNENMLWRAHSGEPVEPADLEEVRDVRAHIKTTVQQAVCGPRIFRRSTAAPVSTFSNSPT